MNNTVDVLQGLNAKQQDAVTAIDGNIRVTAGAGSGKTRVLAHRYAFLVNEVGISPANILCMTFTNKAAQEMKNRIKIMVHQGNVNDFVCTIHGFCVKFLREEIFRLGFPKNFAILDEEDAKDLAKQVMGELGLNKSVETVKQFLADIHDKKKDGRYVGKYMLPNAVLNNKDVFERYLQLQVKLFALDFDDLIHLTLYVLTNYDDVRNKWQERINYIMLDEAQDCNGNDWAIVNAIKGENHNLFIVGDPDQCIYEWRGAMPKYFIDFEPDKDIILDQNYRSTPNILDVANSIISHNEMRIDKNLFTDKVSEKIVLHFHGKSEQEEGNWVATQIENMVKVGAKYSDFAVLYRAQWISRFVEEALLRKQIPYTIWGGIRFFERKEIKDALAYLRLLVYPQDDLSFRRIINVPSRKFGKGSLDKLTKMAEEDNSNLFTALQSHVYSFNNNRAIKDFLSLYQQANIYKDSHSISDTLNYLLGESGYKDAIRLDDDEERIENLEELFNSIKYYEEVNKDEEELSIVNYLQDIALYTNADYKKDTPTVKLMTIHQAKGLEFPYVFVCCLTEGIFPSHRSIRDRRKNGLEEERRLMYVAVTRAEKALFLTESEGYNYSTKMSKYPSRFLSEIKDNLIQVEGNLDPSLLEGTKSAVAQFQEDYQPQPASRSYVGYRVFHNYFGVGVTLSYDNGTQSYKVRFGDTVRNINENHLNVVWQNGSNPTIPVQETTKYATEWHVLASDGTDTYRLDIAHSKEDAIQKAIANLPAPDDFIIYVSDHFIPDDDEYEGEYEADVDEYDIEMEISNYDATKAAHEPEKSSNVNTAIEASDEDNSSNILLNEINGIMTFKGIEVQGSVENFLSKLRDKGFWFPGTFDDDDRYQPNLNEGEIEVSGKIAGYECRGTVHYALKSHNVYSIKIRIDGITISSKDKAKEFVKPYISKYGEPSNISEDSDNDFLNWWYDCDFTLDGDDIISIVCNDNYHPTIEYTNTSNLQLAEKERQEQFFDEI